MLKVRDTENGRWPYWFWLCHRGLFISVCYVDGHRKDFLKHMHTAYYVVGPVLCTSQILTYLFLITLSTVITSILQMGK